MQLLEWINAFDGVDLTEVREHNLRARRGQRGMQFQLTTEEKEELDALISDLQAIVMRSIVTRKGDGKTS